MIRARFKANLDDSRPVNWPIKHPFWESGFDDSHSILIAYADDEAEIRRNWPEAIDIEAEDADDYGFNKPGYEGRFPRPDWFE